MSVPSLEFALALFLLVAGIHLLPTTRWRQILLAACSLALVGSLLPNGWSWLALAVFVLSGYAAARVLQRKPSAAFLTAYLTLLVAGFMVLKKYTLAGLVLPAWITDHPIGAVGLSYVLFRQIHFVVDVMQQQVPEFSLWSYVNYQLNLFGFISGPIQRYQEFDLCWRTLRPLAATRHEVLRAYLRLLVGTIKVSLISTSILTVYQNQQTHFLDPYFLADASRVQLLGRFAIIFYGYLLYLYFNFSGYCDVAIAGAFLVGIKMPENFQRPYLSRNVIDYWTRFHQSLGFWIRDYLFTPLYKAAATRWSGQAKWLVFPCYLIAFVLAGVWHGNTLNFAVFGLLHGCGVCVCKLWEYYLLKRGGRKGLKAYLASRPIHVAAIVVTLHFICFTMLFFPGSVGSVRTTLHNLVHYMTR
jgi:D-alanyl-lipoteichoic acid acyltransferase DltB (MBOAT superfamily)